MPHASHDPSSWAAVSLELGGVVASQVQRQPELDSLCADANKPDDSFRYLEHQRGFSYPLLPSYLREF